MTPFRRRVLAFIVETCAGRDPEGTPTGTAARLHTTARTHGWPPGTSDTAVNHFIPRSNPAIRWLIVNGYILETLARRDDRANPREYTAYYQPTMKATL